MSDQEQHIDYSELAAKKLAGEISEPELGLLDSWIEADPLNREEFETMEIAWNAAQNSSEANSLDVDAEWYRLQSTIGIGTQSNPDSSETKVIRLDRPKRKKPSGMLWKAAAVVLLLLVPYGIIEYMGTDALEYASADSVIEVDLPDGSSIALNKNSKLIYGDKESSNKRKVALTGSAFFDVKRDESKPFVVQTEFISVQVLGTSFYVDADDDLDTVAVYVKSGKVSMGSNFEQDKEIVLVAGEKGLYSKSSGVLIKGGVPDENYLGWKTKKLVFEKKKFKHIIRVINKTYDSEISIESDKIKNCELSFSFDGQKLEEVLEVLEMTVPGLVITKDGDKVLLTGEGC